MVMKKTKYTGVYQDKDTNKIQVQISLGTDVVTGKRKRLKTMKDENNKPFTSLIEAHKFVVKEKAKYFKTGAYATSKMSLETFINEEYLPHYKTTVRLQTYENKLNAIKIINNFFGKQKLKDINVKLVNDFRIWLVNRGYKQSYSSGIFSTLKKILSHAELLNYIQSNPANKVIAIPKGKAKVAFWTKSEFEKVLAQICIDDMYEHLSYCILLTMFASGIRVGEMSALYWSNISFEKKHIHVSHNLIVKNQNDYIRSDQLKTPNANRFVSLDNGTLEVLKDWKERQKSVGLGQEDDFVFSYNGKPMIKSTLSRIIKRYAKLAGVNSSVTAKGLRHSHVSFLINNLNSNVLLISQRLGHSSPEITYKFYSHLYAGADREIANDMNGIINISSADESYLNFNGNQVIKKVPKVSPKDTKKD